MQIRTAPYPQLRSRINTRYMSEVRFSNLPTSALGTRQDTVETIHRALADHGLADERGIDHYVLHGSDASERVIGQVIGKGWLATR